MSNYTETFTSNTGDSIDVSLFETEFDAIATASATKANKISSGTADYLIEQDSGGDLRDTGIPTNTVVLLTGTQTLVSKTLTSPIISNPTFTSLTSIEFEGATADAFETTLTVVDPTADRTVTIPDRTGKINVFYTGVITTSSIDTGLTEDVTITHSLGTDNVFFSAAGECSAGTSASWVAVMLRVDGKTIVAAGNTSLTGTGGASTPSSGDVVVRVRNNSGSTGVITVNYMILAGD